MYTYFGVNPSAVRNAIVHFTMREMPSKSGTPSAEWWLKYPFYNVKNGTKYRDAPPQSFYSIFGGRRDNIMFNVFSEEQSVCRSYDTTRDTVSPRTAGLFESRSNKVFLSTFPYVFYPRRFFFRFVSRAQKPYLLQPYSQMYNNQ